MHFLYPYPKESKMPHNFRIMWHTSKIIQCRSCVVFCFYSCISNALAGISLICTWYSSNYTKANIRNLGHITQTRFLMLILCAGHRKQIRSVSHARSLKQYLIACTQMSMKYSIGICQFPLWTTTNIWQSKYTESRSFKACIYSRIIFGCYYNK